MSGNPNTLDLSNDPDGLKAAIQTQFEAARNAEAQDTAQDDLTVSPSEPGNEFRTTVSSILDAGQFPMATVSDAEVDFTTVSSIEDDFTHDGLRTDTVSGRREVDLDGTL
jgi:hypothetical protein